MLFITASKQGDRKAAKTIMRRHERTAFSAVAASTTDTVEDDDECNPQAKGENHVRSIDEAFQGNQSS